MDGTIGFWNIIIEAVSPLSMIWDNPSMILYRFRTKLIKNNKKKRAWHRVPTKLTKKVATFGTRYENGYTPHFGQSVIIWW